jgi:hypothetical protein
MFQNGYKYVLVAVSYHNGSTKSLLAINCANVDTELFASGLTGIHLVEKKTEN